MTDNRELPRTVIDLTQNTAFELPRNIAIDLTDDTVNEMHEVFYTQRMQTQRLAKNQPIKYQQGDQIDLTLDRVYHFPMQDQMRLDEEYARSLMVEEEEDEEEEEEERERTRDLFSDIGSEDDYDHDHDAQKGRHDIFAGKIRHSFKQYLAFARALQVPIQAQIAPRRAPHMPIQAYPVPAIAPQIPRQAHIVPAKRPHPKHRPKAKAVKLPTPKAAKKHKPAPPLFTQKVLDRLYLEDLLKATCAICWEVLANGQIIPSCGHYYCMYVC
jgi:hypothetical protein